MKYTFVFLALFAFSFGCDRSDIDCCLPKETIELDNIAWEFSHKSSLVQFAGSPYDRYIYVKMDGEDGSFLYLMLPLQDLDSFPSTPYEFKGKAAYYPNSSVQTDNPLEGAATIQLLEVNANTQQLRLAFDADVYEVINAGQDSVARHFNSGELSAIGFKEVNEFAGAIDFEIKMGQDLWQFGGINFGMHYGQISWLSFNNEVYPEQAYFGFIIPWGQALGTYQSDPTIGFPFYYRKGAHR
ncbi:MAG: hypothetical protein H7246_17955, partial [Phycisphaerae bacterium]|nr:hypothetical protein [Saprospiraceae bacterium]